MPLESIPAKYAIIASALQTRIATGAYPVGAMLPSEAQLVREFSASRSTVVRALEYLRQLGYIEGVQGKGRMVLGPPPPPASKPPSRVRLALHAPEATAATVVGAGHAPASPRVAATLAIPTGEPVIARQRLMPATDAGWPTLSTVYLPAVAAGWPTLSTVYLPAVAAGGTAFTATDLLREGALDHLERRRQLVATDVVERVGVRTASARETTLLTLDHASSVLTSLLIVRNSGGHPVLQLDFIHGSAGPAIMRSVQDELARSFKRMKNVSFKPGGDTPDVPAAMTEPDDMQIVTSPCHSYEPIKVPDGRGPFHCLICGSAFAV